MTTNYVQIPDFDYKGQPVYVAVVLTYKFANVVVTSSKNAVAVAGSSPGLVNVEVWDASSKVLLRMTPDAYGNFSGSVNTTALAAGAVAWTMYGWDSLPGQAFTNSDTAAISATVSH